MATVKVGVLRGGPSSEYEVSLKTGGSVLTHLPDHYERHDIFIDRQGRWHWLGLPTSPEQVAKKVDVLFNALHGEYGEDGKLQSQLDLLAVPYTGSQTFASAVGMNKVMAKEVFRRAGLKVPQGVLLRRGAHANYARAVHEKVAPPWVIKPSDRGSSVGLFFARTFPELAEVIEQAFTIAPNLLVEEYIAGREATCGVVDHFRDAPIYALPPIEIRRPSGKKVWDYQDKYSGATEEVCPGLFSDSEKRSIEQAAILAHSALGLRHYSRSDFIVTPRGLYVLEVNSLPGMTPESLLPKALAAIGCPYPQFLDHVIQLALRGK